MYISNSRNLNCSKQLGFFPFDGVRWDWLCPEVLGVTDLYFLSVDASENWWIGTIDGLWKGVDQYSYTNVEIYFYLEGARGLRKHGRAET